MLPVEDVAVSEEDLDEVFVGRRKTVHHPLVCRQVTERSRRVRLCLGRRVMILDEVGNCFEEVVVLSQVPLVASLNTQGPDGASPRDPRCRRAVLQHMGEGLDEAWLAAYVLLHKVNHVAVSQHLSRLSYRQLACSHGPLHGVHALGLVALRRRGLPISARLDAEVPNDVCAQCLRGRLVATCHETRDRRQHGRALGAAVAQHPFACCVAVADGGQELG